MVHVAVIWSILNVGPYCRIRNVVESRTVGVVFGEAGCLADRSFTPQMEVEPWFPWISMMVSGTSWKSWKKNISGDVLWSLNLDTCWENWTRCSTNTLAHVRNKSTANDSMETCPLLLQTLCFQFGVTMSSCVVYTWVPCGGRIARSGDVSGILELIEPLVKSGAEG